MSKIFRYRMFRKTSSRNIGSSPATASEGANDAVIDQFQKHAVKWWHEKGPMKGLHSMNKLRVPFVRDGLIKSEIVKKEFVDTSEPLTGLHILDVGCGGGILSEPLARLGGVVTGIDATPNLIEVAKQHSSTDRTLANLNYICTSMEQHALENQGKYDAVVASEVVEHVTNKTAFLEACVSCLKPKGSIFITTLNKTLASYFGGILIAENVLRLLPSGTHQWDMFIKPAHLQRMLEDQKCRTRLIHGMGYNFVSDTWFWSKVKDINYALHAVKI